MDYGTIALKNSTQYVCRAWVNFNGTGTPAINASGNISSITDRGTGQYEVNFTTSMPDAKYAVCYGMNDISGVGNEHAVISSLAVGSFYIRTSLSNDSWADAAEVYASVFR